MRRTLSKVVAHYYGAKFVPTAEIAGKERRLSPREFKKRLLQLPHKQRGDIARAMENAARHAREVAAAGRTAAAPHADRYQRFLDEREQEAKQALEDERIGTEAATALADLGLSGGEVIGGTR